MPLDIGVLAKDANVAPNIHKEANRATTVQIKARGDASHSFTAYGVDSDASSNRDEFLITRALEAESSLDSRLFIKRCTLQKPRQRQFRCQNWYRSIDYLCGHHQCFFQRTQ